MQSTPKRIVITGGSGKAGRHLIPLLQAQGHSVLNLDIAALPGSTLGAPPPGSASNSTSTFVHTIRTDLTDSGQVFNALSSHFACTEPLPPHLPKPPDAVIHLASLSTPLQAPDSETFRTNTQGTHNVIEAACKLGIPRIIIASSVTVYGVTFAQGAVNFPYIPVDENAPTLPEDTYALTKIIAERIGESFSRRFRERDVSVTALRIGRVVTPDEYTQPMWRSYIESPSTWGVHGWGYIDVRDLATLIEKCLDQEQTAAKGYRCFNAVAEWISNYEDGNELVRHAMPGVEFKRPLRWREGVMSCEKAQTELGWRCNPEYDWVRLVDQNWAKDKRAAMEARRPEEGDQHQAESRGQ